MVKKLKIALDSSEASGHICITLTVLKRCELETSYMYRWIFSISFPLTPAIHVFPIK